MDDKIYIDFEPNDFILRITPLLDNTDRWTGELRIKVNYNYTDNKNRIPTIDSL